MAAVARTAARPAAAGALAPASPFAELLRRSRFASYDPQIKQTYGAPPEYAHRGNWGLKRPIAKKHRNTYITLKSYEDHAQFIEWSNAHAEVRFVKTFAELNVTPHVAEEGRYGKALGENESRIWLTDSEFDHARDREYRYVVETEPAVEATEPKDVSIDDLGKRGPGQYTTMHTKTTIPERSGAWSYRQPTLDAMSSSEFDAYLDRLRALRPAFYARIRDELARQTLRPPGINPSTNDLMLAISRASSADHRVFINDFFERQYSSRSDDLAAPDPESGDALPKDFVQPRIKPQPHRSGGLMYAHPTLLDTFFSTKPKPAFVIAQNTPHARSPTTASPLPMSVSFGGVVAELDRPTPALQPLFRYNSGPDAGVSPRNVVDVRLSKFELRDVPSVVGKDAVGLDSMFVRSKVTQIFSGKPERHATAAPGSFEYVGSLPTSARHRMMTNWNATTPGYARMAYKPRGGKRLAKTALLSQLRGMAASEAAQESARRGSSS